MFRPTPESAITTTCVFEANPSKHLRSYYSGWLRTEAPSAASTVLNPRFVIEAPTQQLRRLMHPRVIPKPQVNSMS